MRTAEADTGWLPDLIYTGGEFRSGLAMFADAGGVITRFSSQPDDLAHAQRLTNRALLPGLVNGHSHAFQRALRGRTEHRTAHGRDSFWTWRESMYRAAKLLSPEGLYQASRMAFLEMLLGGITTVGEFHYVHHAAGGTPYSNRNELALEVLRAARDTGLRIALLRTAYVRSGWNKPAEPGQARFITPRVEDFIADTDALRTTLASAQHADRAWVGVAPHSLRAVPLPYLREVAAYARAQQLPMHMHVSEQPADVEANLGEYGMRPVELLDQQGLLDSRFTAVHAIHITGEEVSALSRAGSMVCACPTTERNLGDGTVAADQFLRAGIRVSLGSDSNVQIHLLEDARELEYHLRMLKLERAVLTAKHLFACATEAGAASVGSAGGVLEAGRPADFFTVALDDPSIAGADADSLLGNIVFSAERSAVRDVAVGGKFVIREGRHPKVDEIVQEFAGLQRQLWAG
ncbi:MAG TPA: formimidoylglutamate deiminase [Bryobacteraceae bacterium]|nr:formimidoylglutamate deiminase [Bryobacteraceae bacterium]